MGLIPRYGVSLGPKKAWLVGKMESHDDAAGLALFRELHVAGVELKQNSGGPSTTYRFIPYLLWPPGMPRN